MRKKTDNEEGSKAENGVGFGSKEIRSLMPVSNGIFKMQMFIHLFISNNK